MGSQVDEECYRLVLRKLKRLMVDGSFVASEVRYIYNWDETKSIKINLENVRKEDAALRYFEQIKLVHATRFDNVFKKEGGKVWGKSWSKVEPAYREYEWVVELYAVDNDKFEAELKKFNLEDTGMELIDPTPALKLSLIQGQFGKFTAHKDGSIRYQKKIIELKPELKRLVHALILEKGGILQYNQIVDALWNEELGTQAYLENQQRETAQIKRRISNIVSEANSALFGYGNTKHLLHAGETSYKLVP